MQSTEEAESKRERARLSIRRGMRGSVCTEQVVVDVHQMHVAIEIVTHTFTFYL